MTAPRDSPVGGPGPLARLLSADHAEMDGCFQDAREALEHDLPVEARALIDRIWIRLAVHIRAEHKVLFPALSEALPQLRSDLQTLREEHDFFMATLAEGVKVLQEPAPDLPSARTALESVWRRLASHNSLEEEQIYPGADRLPQAQLAQLLAAASRELAFLPQRYER
ncbi:MAG TPA: hemerythrin domain-containing protein [Geothrix sp.]|nr:hemerythrin domain-containing protein [Geothrix sp.]